jgi:hypothetical protein
VYLHTQYLLKAAASCPELQTVVSETDTTAKQEELVMTSSAHLHCPLSGVSGCGSL